VSLKKVIGKLRGVPITQVKGVNKPPFL